MKKGVTIGAFLAFAILASPTSYAQEGIPLKLSISKAHDTFGRDISGDDQLATVKHQAAQPIIVSVRGPDGLPARSVPIVFSVVGEPEGNIHKGVRARVAQDTVLTDGYGYAKTHVRLGAEPGYYHLTARIAGQESHINFTIRGMRKGWPAFSVFGLVGGLSLFLFGLNFVGRALNRAAGGRLRHMIFSLSERKAMGILVGALLTILVQSSSATVAMLMSFANAGLVNLSQSLGLILGAEVGTTLTIQVIAFRVTSFAPLLVALGFLLMSLRQPYVYLGRTLFGVGMVFLGLRLMADAVAPLQASPQFKVAIAFLGTKPLLTAILAALFAAVARSSAGPIGVAIMLGYEGIIDLNGAVAVVLGANLGSAVTALLGAVRSTTEGRRVALAHTVFKLVVVIIFFVFIRYFTGLLSIIGGSTARQIANAHTILNLAAVVLFFPIVSPYERVIKALVKEGPETLRRKPRYLDDTVLDTPSLAIGQAQREAMRMADIVMAMFAKVKDVLRRNDDTLRKEIVAEDDRVDELAGSITTYLTRISQEELTKDQSLRGVALLHIVDELESVGDVVSKSLMIYAKKKIELGFYFSKEGFSEINEFHEFVSKSLRMAVTSFSSWDGDLARKTLDRRVEGERRQSRLHDAHIDRLRKDKKESLDTSSVHLDLIRDLERINFHAANTAEAVLGRM
ncbi:Na/Pi cotransporter family protein [candidate division TA06 bacterium]|uniref:Na/Pi cotransporter family protein n=1 Tax=candidate division TA06 bacterium TaxID=2250710 RepID=A0A523UN09_UNCT6|nr:MAG: Na/Pi cotransporter family protein [candidate division TA06 bacterium]